ncbi:MAG: FHA domain-containing protein [Bdellovibrionota bacterium]
MDKTRIIIADVSLVDMKSHEKVRLLDELVVGRMDCGLNFPSDTKISRRHLRFVPADDVVMVEDLGSRNNTLVNGKFLRPNVLYKLRSRDVIEFGSQKYQIIIGGKIAEEPSKGAKQSAEVTAVFSKFISTEDKAKAKKAAKTTGRTLDGLEDFSNLDTVPTFEESEVAFSKLLSEQGASWFLQFEGSEFGPLSFNEMKTIVGSEKFQGGQLFVWAEGLPTWTPIDKSHRIFQKRVDPMAPTDVSIRPAPLVAMVIWNKLEGGKKIKITGTCESISPQEITVVCKDKPADTTPFEIEISPRKGLGIERFKMTVKFNPERVKTNSYTLEVVAATKKTIMVLERYVREENSR